jgi:hypothetical protein
VAKEGLAIGGVSDRQWKDGVSPPDHVTGIGLGVTKADDGGETALAAAGVAGDQAQKDEEEEEYYVKCSHSLLL